MTPKEKALEICDKYFTITQESGYANDIDAAKQCALIAVDEIINALRKDLPEIGLGKGYWHDVKKEIENL